MQWIEQQLDRLTMYQVVTYGLFALSAWSFLGSVLGFLPFTFFELLASHLALSFSTIITHYTFAWVFRAPANRESSLITALILFFILEPSAEWSAVLGIGAAGAIAVASKYLLVWRRVHLFNPVAIAAVIVGLSFLVPVTWWVGSRFMFVPTLFIGLLVVKKIRRFDLFWTAICVSTLTTLAYGATRGLAPFEILTQHFLSWPIVFFASFMLTEPLSTPPRRNQRIAYAAFIGVISSVPLHVGSVYSTPELTLVVANLYSFFMGLRGRLRVPLSSTSQIAKDIWEYRFTLSRPLPFLPGQYLEWALVHPAPDSRGIKRYLTIASSPTESELIMAVKIPQEPSSFKRALQSMKQGDSLYISQLIGDFILPRNPSESPLVFIAGGIGVTPFRSMVKYLLDTKQSFSATLFYCVNHPDELAYMDLFEAARAHGLHIVPIVSKDAPSDWQGETGFVTGDLIRKHVKTPDRALYYISGPPGMVHAYESMLLQESIPNSQIKTDFFPGYAP